MSEAAKRTLNGFKKGHPTYLKNHSAETKERLSEIAKKDGRRPFQPKGFKHSEETLKLLSKIRKANPNHYWLGRNKPFMSTFEYRKKMSLAMKKLVASGKHNFWKGGITVPNKQARSSLEYKFWRESVFKRDDFTCQACSIRGSELNAHHIKPFFQAIDDRLNVENGVTLCFRCHKMTDSFGHRALHLSTASSGVSLPGVKA